MVHQSPRSSAEYEQLMQSWGEFFTCIAPDTPGFGQSDPLPADPQIDDFADALGEFVRALGLERCAAYGFHSGGIILMRALMRGAIDLSALAIGGYALWTEEERARLDERYLPPLKPSAYGEHLVWLWNRMLEQSWFFPWFDTSDEARLDVAHADPERVHQAVMEMLDAGDAYRAGYGAVLRAPRDIPPPDAKTPPVLISAYSGDPLLAHIDRLGKLPAGWESRKCSSPLEHQEASLEFLRRNCDMTGCPALAENQDEGWIALSAGLIHWSGVPGAPEMELHAPAMEMTRLTRDHSLAIDAPGHGFSSGFEDMIGAVEEAAHILSADKIAWPKAPTGDPGLLYPDLSPDRFGGHLLRAWGAARAEAIFRPWYQADKEHAIPIDPSALEPSAIADRTRARLRAGAHARSWHMALVLQERRQS